MSEAEITLPAAFETEAADPASFSLEAEVKGLPYVLEGRLPERPGLFEWDVRVADPQPSDDPHWNLNYLRSQGLDNGIVATVHVGKKSGPHGEPGIFVHRIASEPRYLKGYENAEGVGSFLLDQLCTLADVKGWRIYLVPIERGGKLMQGELYDWYRRRGFKHPFEYEDDSYGSDLERRPQEPDPNQPILGAIEAAQAA